MALDLRGVLLGSGPSEKPSMGLGVSGAAMVDPAEEVARIAAARRSRLLRVYRRRLRFEDLEDCYSQATLELVARARRAPFANSDHVANALELRFRSRIDDRRRAIEGRSAIEAAIAHAVPVDAPGHGGAADLEDRAAAVERQVFARTEMRVLREVIADLTRDQQLVLASQVLVDMEPAEFCARYSWSVEKYRKVAQRARIKLRGLVDEYDRGDRCARLEPDLLAFGAGTAEGPALVRARTHVANCPSCSRMIADPRRGAGPVGAVAPAPVAGGGLLAGVWSGLRRLLGIARHPLAEAGASGGAGAGAGVASGSLVGAGALKVGIAAVCVVGAAGTYAACSHLGVLPGLGIPGITRHAKPRERTVAVRREPRRQRRTEPSQTRSQHRRRAVDAHHAAASAGSVAPAVDPAPTPVTQTLAVRRDVRRLSRIAQIRREFGRPPSRAAAARAQPVASASGGSTAAAGAATSSTGAAPASPASGRAPPAQSATQAGQTQAEFGFER
jgi:hypothetical protein